ncbi:hypothetical protein [uncultured Cyclobacterium sp.]|uniref:hypothetical protein n=1 Tax=uncultured Cyclobacterium sp. TaxID=453820 RepID=UPI0030EED26F
MGFVQGIKSTNIAIVEPDNAFRQCLPLHFFTEHRLVVYVLSFSDVNSVVNTADRLDSGIHPGIRPAFSAESGRAVNGSFPGSDPYSVHAVAIHSLPVEAATGSLFQF